MMRTTLLLGFLACGLQASTMQLSAMQLAAKANVPEIVPTDFFASLSSPESMSKIMYGCSVILLGIIVTCIYYNRGVSTVVKILAYIYSLSSMSVLIRNVYVNHNFNFPQWVTASHFLATGLTGLAVLLYRRQSEGKEITVPSAETFYKGIGPVALSFALSIGFANRGLMYTNTHFYEMIASTSMLVTAGVGILMGKGFNLKLLPPLLAVTTGLCVVSFGELSFNMIGFACIAFGTVMRATKVQLQSILLGKDSNMTQLDPIELTFWTASSCFVVMMVWSLAAEGLEPFVLVADISTLLAVLVTAVAATILNIAALFVLKEVGPVAQQIVGNLKGVLACMAAVAAFGEVITLQQALGYTVVVAAAFWYNRTDTEIKEAAKKQGLEQTPLNSEGEKKV